MVDGEAEWINKGGNASAMLNRERSSIASLLGSPQLA